MTPKNPRQPDNSFPPVEPGDRDKRSESPVSWWIAVRREDWHATVQEQAERLALSPMGQRGGGKESW